MHDYRPRDLESVLADRLDESPIVALLGPRQVGKTTLAREVSRRLPGAITLDLERPSDRRKLTDPELFFDSHPDVLVCLDEIQRAPGLFEVLRSVVDRRARPGQFLVLGSASRDLLRQSAESLAGRIHYLELTPFQLSEVEPGDQRRLWLRGGFPRSLLAVSEPSSLRWREDFVQTFLERDLPQLGYRVPAESVRRLWTMLAHSHGQLLNSSRLGQSLGWSHTTVRSHIDILQGASLVRMLPPLHANVRKRLVRSPKLYVRDSGLLHALLELEDWDDLLGHPVFGASWEGFALEQVLGALPRWRASFYRTAGGAELDLVLERGGRRLAVEFKASTAPKVTRGFHQARKDLGDPETWVIAPVAEPYPLREGVKVAPLTHLLAVWGEGWRVRGRR